MESEMESKMESNLEFEQILELIDHVVAAGLSSFVYETEGVKLSMKGRQPVCASGAQGAVCAGGAGVQSAERETDAARQMAVSPAGLGDSAQAGGQEQLSGRIITSPLVGTFYAAPSEDAAPFVKVGDSVKEGQVLAIVEAMKLMNEIESDYDGVVTRILVQDGDPVEYGQPLFCVE